MGKAICCDICSTFERVNDEYSSHKIMIRDGGRESKKFADYDLCTNCLLRVYTLFSEIGNCSQGNDFTCDIGNCSQGNNFTV